MFDEIDPKPDIVKYNTWKRVDMQNKIKKTMVVEQEASLQEFQTIVKQKVEVFCEHVSRLRAQYNQLKTYKSTLAKHDVIVQMDFAENYTCRTLDEVKTASWSLTSVTRHPVVVYYRLDTELKHKS